MSVGFAEVAYLFSPHKHFRRDSSTLLNCCSIGVFHVCLYTSSKLPEVAKGHGFSSPMAGDLGFSFFLLCWVNVLIDKSEQSVHMQCNADVYSPKKCESSPANLSSPGALVRRGLMVRRPSQCILSFAAAAKTLFSVWSYWLDFRRRPISSLPVTLGTGGSSTLFRT